MKKTALIAMAAVVLMGGAGCNRAKTSGPETALDRAYHAGILSKGEYEAKKTALTASAVPPANAPMATPLPVVVPAPALAVTAAPAPAKVPAAPKATIKAPAAQPVVVTAPIVETPEPAAPVRPAAQDEETREPVPPVACEDSEVRPGKEKGMQERFYPMPPSKVRAALLQTLDDLGFQIHTATDTRIEAGRKRHIGLVVGHGGEKVTLHLEEATEGRQRGTRVTGETKKSFVMRVGQKSWTNAVLDQAGCTLHTSGHAAGLEHGKAARQSTY
jgi:hypothetical protein